MKVYQVDIFKKITRTLVILSLVFIITKMIFSYNKPMVGIASKHKLDLIGRYKKARIVTPTMEKSIHTNDSMLAAYHINVNKRGPNYEMDKNEDGVDYQMDDFKHLSDADARKNSRNREISQRYNKLRLFKNVQKQTQHLSAENDHGHRNNGGLNVSQKELIQNDAAYRLPEIPVGNYTDTADIKQTHEHIRISEETSNPLNETTNFRTEAHNSIYSLSSLSRIFREKLEDIPIEEFRHAQTCNTTRVIGNSCDGGKCLQMGIPESPKTRLAQIMTLPTLQLSDSQNAILQRMASKVKGHYEVILMTAASSNHFLESQALLKNLHDFVFPNLNNFTLLFYDLGLTKDEREQMRKFCRCQLLSFPFSSLPHFVSNLKCYAWKPVVVKAHIHQAEVVLWMDASVRFKNSSSKLQEFIMNIKTRGVQVGHSNADSTFRTSRSMYHFFGDEPCAYLGMGQAVATFGGYHNEPLVERAVLEPWVACALNQLCMCPPDFEQKGCSERKISATVHGEIPFVYGFCHKFDQAAISLILHKLYSSQYTWVFISVGYYMKLAREHKLNYFDMLKTKETRRTKQLE